MVIWITGLPATGKTVVADALAALIRVQSPNVLRIDGDEIRSALGIVERYLPEERYGIARAYSRLSALFSNQGLLVICSTVSMFDEVREETKLAARGYFEVFLQATDDVRRARKPALLGGHGMTFSESNYQLPKAADLTLDNNGQNTPSELGAVIVSRLGL